MFLVGLAVILALVFGVASTASSATGDNFLLGKANRASAVSKLTANIANPAMQLANTSSAATALNLQVTSGNPPLKVNSDTRVEKLNADKVDGLEGASFMQGGGRASQAILPDSSATIVQTSDPAVTVLYECPSNPTTQRGRLELPSIGLMVAVLVAPPSGSEPSLLGQAASQ
ncbi:MAG TPA: hypothetical protein VF068_11015 [Rubrobacter sp.]